MKSNPSTRSYRFITLLLLFFTPLLVSPITKEAFEFPKMMFVYLLCFLLLSVYLTDVIIKGRKIIFGSIWVILLIFLVFISTIFSGHIYTSVFGYYSRFNEGLLSYLAFFSFYLVLKNVFTKQELIRFLPMAVLSAFLVSLYAIYQHLFVTSEDIIFRAYSTMGIPNLLAQYLLLLLPIVIFLILYSGFLWIVVYFIVFMGFCFTYSLSGLLALISSFVFIAFYLLSKGEKDKFVKFITIIVFTLVMSFQFLGPIKYRIHDAFVDFKNIFLNRKGVYANVGGHIVSDPGNIRANLWRGTISMIFSTPKIFLIGTGPSTFAYEFQFFRPMDLNYSSEWELVVNKPHNYYLEIWSNLGIFVFIVYLVILVKTFTKVPWYLKASLITIFITNMFGWSSSVASLLFWYAVSISEATND